MTLPGYILCATPRSGSTLLCALLTATGVAGRPKSYFRAQSRPGYAARFQVAPDDLTAYLGAVRGTGHKAGGRVAVRLMAEARRPLLAELQARLGAGSDAALLTRALGPVVYIHLSRQDVVEQAISRLRAEQSGLWHRWRDGGEILPPSRPGGLVYDPDALAAHVRCLRRWEDDWQTWFSAQGIRPHRVEYEDLARDPRGVLSAVLTAIGADPAHAAGVTVSNERLADDLTRAWAARFRAEHPGLA